MSFWLGGSNVPASTRVIPRANHASCRDFHITVQGGLRDLQRRADVIRIHRLVGKEFIGKRDLGVAWSQWGSTTCATSGTSGGETGFGPLLDQSTLELRE